MDFDKRLWETISYISNLRFNKKINAFLIITFLPIFIFRAHRIPTVYERSAFII